MTTPVRYMLLALTLAATLAAHAKQPAVPATPAAAPTNTSMLRVVCEANDIGAEVSVNGKFKGECPVDMQVAPGSLTLRVVKRVSDEYERAFDQEIRMGDGVVKKVEAVLTNGWTAAAKKRAEAPLAELISCASKGQAFEQLILFKKSTEGLDFATMKKQEGNDEAVNWLRKAAEQGYAPAQFELGMGSIYGGFGIRKDHAEAFKWLRKAAGQGYARGQSNLGDLYRDGKGVAQSYEEALKWYHMAEAQGDSDGQLGLGKMYRMGYGVAKDQAEAIRWYRKAFAQGNFGAKMELVDLGLETM